MARGTVPEPARWAVRRDQRRPGCGTSVRARLGAGLYTLALSGGRRSLVLSTGGTMTEILTESFCERCGTRYTFETAAPRRSRIGRVRVATRGLRNYVMQDESSFSEAMADARSDEERSATTHQLDAFHKTFNFCMTCRQYTCGNCWNTADGRCLTCAPLPEVEPPAADLAEVVVAEPPEAAEPRARVTSTRTRMRRGPRPTSHRIGLPAPWDWLELPPMRKPLPGSLPRRRRRRSPTLRRCGASRPARAWRMPSPHTRRRSRRRKRRPWRPRPSRSREAEPAAVEPVAVEPVAAGRAGRGRAGRSRAEPVAASRAGRSPSRSRSSRSSSRSQPRPSRGGRAGRGRAGRSRAGRGGRAGRGRAGRRPSRSRPSRSRRAGRGRARVAVEPRSCQPEPSRSPPRLATTSSRSQRGPSAPGAPETSAVPQPAPQPTAEPTAPSNPWLTVAPDDGSAAPQWPTAPQWTRSGTTRELPTTLAGRPIVPQDNAAALWAASAREVLTGGPNPVNAGNGRAGHTPAVRELRPLTLAQRPVLSPLWDPPGLIATRPASSAPAHPSRRRSSPPRAPAVPARGPASSTPRTARG